MNGEKILQSVLISTVTHPVLPPMYSGKMTISGKVFKKYEKYVFIF